MGGLQEERASLLKILAEPAERRLLAQRQLRDGWPCVHCWQLEISKIMPAKKSEGSLLELRWTRLEYLHHDSKFGDAVIAI